MNTKKCKNCKYDFPKNETTCPICGHVDIFRKEGLDFSSFFGFFVLFGFGGLFIKCMLDQDFFIKVINLVEKFLY